MLAVRQGDVALHLFPQDRPVNIHDVELLSRKEIMGILRMGPRGARRLIKTLPPNAVLRSGRGGRLLVHSWALAKHLKMDNCPGCGRAWPK